MNQKLQQYVQTARGRGLSDEQIRLRLLDAGWDSTALYTALDGSEELVPPRADMSPQPSAATAAPSDREGVNVVETGFSGSGFEYLIYFIALGIVALAVGALLHNMVDIATVGSTGFYGEIIPFATASLIVSAPIFLWLMLRLRRKEQQNPGILHDHSRRRAIQFLLVITFLIGVGKLVGYVYGILTFSSASSYYGEPSLLAETLHAIITIGLAGGIFAYYFREHARVK